MGERIKIPQYSDVIMVAANYFTRETLNTKLEALFAIIIILGGLQLFVCQIHIDL